MAEVRTKRFDGRQIEDDRYTATVAAGAATPHAFLAALTDAVARIEDFQRAVRPGEQLILQINLRS